MSNRFSENLTFVLHALVLTMGKIADKELNFQLNLTFSQFLVLVILENHPNIKQKKIGEFLNVSEAAVSKSLKILTSKKLIEIKPSLENKATKSVSLNKIGLETFKKAWTLLNNLTKETTQGISSQDIATTQRVLSSMFQKTQTRIKNYKKYANKR